MAEDTRLQQADAERTGELTAYGLWAQAASQGVTQLGPAVDRMFLTSAGPGYISSYEMSDRLFYAATQFFTLTFLYRRLAGWAQLPTMARDRATQLLRHDGRTLGGAAAALTAAGIVGALVALASGLLPGDWTQGFWWGAVVMLSVPAHMFNVIGTRLLVVARKQHFMIWIAVSTAVLNAALDSLFYVLFGPVGIVVSTVLVRWTMAGVYLVMLRSVVPRMVGEALTDAPVERPAG